MSAAGPQVLVLVGTDHHPFDRLIGWADAYAAAHPDAQVVVQHGQSAAPHVAAGVDFLDRDGLTAAIEAADVVVCHGGPATISDARTAGHRPVVVPRDPAYGEHVDDHQVRFSTWLAGKGLVELVRDTADLDAAVAAGLEHGRGAGAGADAVADSVQRFGDLVRRAQAGEALRSGPVVLYLAGFGRSGSTLLERLVAQTPGVCSLGEVVHLWQRGVLDDDLCGCCQPFSACPFWTEVGQVAFGGWDRAHALHVLALRAQVDRKRRIAATMWSATTPGTRRALAGYADAYAAVYRAAAQVSGAAVVVDSSKHVSLAFALSHDADLDLRVLHLVRDPRAVTYSWSKEVERPEVRDGTELMPTYSTATSAGRWTTTNLLVELFRVRGRPVHRMRYEDLVRDPTGELTRAADALRLPVAPELALDGGTVDLEAVHSVAGNPMRFTTGPVTLRVDDAWKDRMPPGPRRAVGALTGPLRRWYGLPGRR